MKRLFIGITLLLFAFQVNAYDENDLKRFKALKKCPGCDLSGADFKGRNLEGANLQGALLDNAILSNANLKCKNHPICSSE